MTKLTTRYAIELILGDAVQHIPYAIEVAEFGRKSGSYCLIIDLNTMVAE